MSRTLRALAPLLFVFAFLIAGCGHPEEKFAGTYSGKQQLSKAAEDLMKKQPGGAAQLAQMDKAQINLTLNKDKTASLALNTGAVGAAPMNVSGTWAYTSNNVVVTLNPGGGGGSEPMKLTPSEDGKTLTAGGSQYGSMVFTKN